MFVHFLYLISAIEKIVHGSDSIKWRRIRQTTTTMEHPSTARACVSSICIHATEHAQEHRLDKLLNETLSMVANKLKIKNLKYQRRRNWPWHSNWPCQQPYLSVSVARYNDSIYANNQILKIVTRLMKRIVRITTMIMNSK